MSIDEQKKSTFGGCLIILISSVLLLAGILSMCSESSKLVIEQDSEVIHE